MRAAQSFLKSVQARPDGSEFCYLKGDPPTPTMTAVGLLGTQYLGAERGDPSIVKGVGYLLQSADRTLPDCYYWYYATQVMHNVPGPEWDRWNRQMRRVLIETQEHDGCAFGELGPQ